MVLLPVSQRRQHSSTQTIIMSQSITVMRLIQLPDELLARILSFVPYSKEQHECLESINIRIKAIVERPAFRMQLAREQYPRVVALEGIEIVENDTQLSALVDRQSAVDEAVRKLSESGDNVVVRGLLSIGVQILDFWDQLRGPNKAFNCVLAEAAKRQVLTVQMTTAMRLVIERAWKHFNGPDDQSPLVANNGVFALSVHLSSIPSTENHWIELDNMLTLRSFEASFFMSNSPLTISGMLEKGKDAKSHLSDMAWNTDILSHSLSCGFVGDRPLFGIMFTPRNSCLGYLQGMQWRLLSRDDIELPSINISFRDAEIGTFLATELAHQRAFHKDIKAQGKHHESGKMAVLAEKIEWKKLGVGLRGIAHFCAKKMVPEGFEGETVVMRDDYILSDGQTEARLNVYAMFSDMTRLLAAKTANWPDAVIYADDESFDAVAERAGNADVRRI